MSTLANAWTDAGHDVSLVTTHDDGGRPHYELDNRVSLRSVDPRGSGLDKQPRIVRNLRKELRRANPDVVVSFLNYTNVIALIASRGLGCPVIVSERLDPRIIAIGPLWSTLRRITYRWAECLVVQTPTAARLLEYLAPGRTTIIPNPVPAPPPPLDAAIESCIPAVPTVLAVGRLQPQKGFDLALRAMAELGPAHSDWQLVILGEGPERGALEALRDELRLGGRVHMPGRVSDTWPWLRRADIFLMSSRSEGFPNALCEAMAAGVPVISTDCLSGPSDIVTPGVDGLLVEPENVESMAVALRTMMDSDDLRRRLAKAAPRIIERYSLENVLELWNGVLARVARS